MLRASTFGGVLLVTCVTHVATTMKTHLTATVKQPTITVIIFIDTTVVASSFTILSVKREDFATHL